MNLLKKRNLFTAAGSITAIAVILFAGRAQAGFNGSRCTWDGSWNSSWSSSTGEYNSQVDMGSGSWGVNGTYNNGKFEGLYVFNNPNEASGTWRRITGNSGGRCQSGGFYFTLSPNPINNKCKIYGSWDYCSSGQRWRWNLEQSL